MGLFGKFVKVDAVDFGDDFTKVNTMVLIRSSFTAHIFQS